MTVTSFMIFLSKLWMCVM